MRRSTIVFLVLCIEKLAPSQGWWLSPENGTTCKVGTCGEYDTMCECSLTIEDRLTMMTSDPPALVRPNGGKLYFHNDTKYEHPLSDDATSNVITVDGYGSRLVIAVNGKFPGPTIEAHEGQLMIIHVRNLMLTDSTSIHWHGIHQRGTPYTDGVAFISQCPILPGQTFTYTFTACPHGTSFYHAHIGNQRSIGLYGGLIVYPRYKFYSQPQIGFTVLLQDWNHHDEPEALHQPTQSIDGAKFSGYHMHSALMNGKGRYYTSINSENGAPLEIFEVEHTVSYRFRIISAATMYPFRVYVQGHPEITVRASDGFEIVQGSGKNSREIVVDSFIIHPGERFDFTFTANKKPGTYLLVAESIEDLSGSSPPQYHAAEAIIQYKGAPFNYPAKDTQEQDHCTSLTPCFTFNCPYLYYPKSANRKCLTFDRANSNSFSSSPSEVQNVDKTLFFNFAFPGKPGNTPGSVNGHRFVLPTTPILTHESALQTRCDDSKCGPDTICACTYSVELFSDRIYQFVITNLGSGRGWSHPVHLHGHYFYVMKMGFGKYDEDSGRFVSPTSDIQCLGSSDNNYCNSAQWADSSWTSNVNIPGLNLDYPPEKDTIIVPSGGYVVIRFKADNPGAWLFHCNIDLHNTDGMGMVLLESKDRYPASPEGTLTCGEQIGKYMVGLNYTGGRSSDNLIEHVVIPIVVIAPLGVVLIAIICWIKNKHSHRDRSFDAETQHIGSLKTESQPLKRPEAESQPLKRPEAESKPLKSTEAETQRFKSSEAEPAAPSDSDDESRQ